MSREEIIFLDILNHSAKMTDGHYCLAFKQIAKQPEPLLSKKEKFHDEHKTFLKEMIDNGFAEMVLVDPLSLVLEPEQYGNFKSDTDFDI